MLFAPAKVNLKSVNILLSSFSALSKKKFSWKIILSHIKFYPCSRFFGE